MANDRLYLTCPLCGQGFMLAKHFADQWYTKPSTPEEAWNYVCKLDDFLEQHWNCMAGVAEDPHKLLLLNEIEQFEYEQKMLKAFEK